MYIIAGLGNPDAKYFGTRHNAGFHAIDYLSQKMDTPVKKLKCKSLLGEGRLGGEKVVLAKPQTYMNASGEAVRELADWYKVAPERVIILYDDIALPAGGLRVRDKGSAGGHNGIKSIISCLNTDGFKRVRIGVGSPAHASYELVDYVLGKFTREEQELVFGAMERAAAAVEDMIRNGVQHAMNQYNQRGIGATPTEPQTDEG